MKLIITLVLVKTLCNEYSIFQCCFQGGQPLPQFFFCVEKTKIKNHQQRIAKNIIFKNKKHKNKKKVISSMLIWSYSDDQKSPSRRCLPNFKEFPYVRRQLKKKSIVFSSTINQLLRLMMIDEFCSFFLNVIFQKNFLFKKILRCSISPRKSENTQHSAKLNLC